MPNRIQFLQASGVNVTTLHTSGKLPSTMSPSRTNKPRSTATIADQKNGALAGLMHQARLFEKLDKQLKNELDPQMAEHCQVACIRNHRLVILTPTPAWRTRLQLLSSGLLSRLRTKGHPGLTGIEIKVSPLLTEQVVTPRPRKLSNAARDSLSRFANDCPDPSMKAIARRMVRKREEKE